MRFKKLIIDIIFVILIKSGAVRSMHGCLMIFMSCDFLDSKGVGSRMPIIGPVDCQKKQILITSAV